MSDISISWVSGHRRSVEIARVAQVSHHFVKSKKRFLPFRYLAQHLETLRILKKEQPTLVVVMQPPPLALFSVLASRHTRRAVIVGDLHSGVFFDPKWSWAKNWVLRTLRRRGFAIVPNDDLAEICARADTKVIVCHGYLEVPQHHHEDCQAAVLPSRPFVMVPFAYSRDEPVADVLHAAALTPEVDWVLTGKAPAELRAQASENVFFPGFVSASEYQTLRHHTHAILALTTQESTMQSAGYEAIAGGTPLITVPTRVLRDYFEDGAIYTELDSAALASAVREVLAKNELWRSRMQEQRKKIMQRQDEPQKRIADLVERTRSRNWS